MATQLNQLPVYTPIVDEKSGGKINSIWFNYLLSMQNYIKEQGILIEDLKSRVEALENTP